MLAFPPAAPFNHQAPLANEREQVVTAAPIVEQRVAVQQVVSRSDIITETEHWTWAELRDYVVGEIIERFGPFPRDSRKEYGIFNRFLSEYGQDGIAVAKYAFGPVCDGWWGSAPISINRFCKASDPYFAKPILDRLADTHPTTA